MNHDKIPSYVLNDFLKFERKLYNIFGLKLARSIQFKTLLYFAGTGVTVFLLSFLPIIGTLIRTIPLMIVILLSGAVAYLLSDIGTENRPPLRFFASFLRYHWSAFKKQTYYKGKVLPKQKNIKFVNHITVMEPRTKKETPPPEAESVKFDGVSIR